MKGWPIFGATSVHASQLALGAVELGGYQDVHHALMAAGGMLTIAQVEERVGTADIAAEDAFEAYDASRARWDGFMARNSRQVATLGLRGTPAFIIGTRLYAGALDEQTLRTAIAEARAS